MISCTGLIPEEIRMMFCTDLVLKANWVLFCAVLDAIFGNQMSE